MFTVYLPRPAGFLAAGLAAAGLAAAGLAGAAGLLAAGFLVFVVAIEIYLMINRTLRR